MSFTKRNELCSCGSGKKYKKCCLSKQSGSTPEPQLSADQYVQQGLAQHQAGQLQSAHEAYQHALSLNPQHPDALHLLGMLAQQVGDYPLALKLIRSAIQIKPDMALYYCNLGTVLQASGQLDAAIINFQQALAIDPQQLVYHFNLAHALQKLGKLPEAVDHYRAALALAPAHIESLSNLGHTLLALGELEQAVEVYRKATSVAPNFAEMHFNLGSALNAQGKAEAAIESYRRAIALFPDYAQAWCNLGALLLTQNQFDEATASYRRAIAISPDFAEAHYNLGIALQAQNQLDDAIASYRRTLELQPEFVAGYCNLGNALRAQGCLQEARQCYQQALVIKPDYSNAYSNLLFLDSYHALSTPEQYLHLARGWELACIPANIRQAALEKKFSRMPLSGRKLKVGYVSGDFRKHAVSYFIEQVFANHDHSRIELYAYSSNRVCDAVTERLAPLADHWTVVTALSDAELCTRIEADQLDVLIDLSAHSAHNRLAVFARRAAPVQATYFYFASTGLTAMDYWIGDEVLTPPALDQQFSEQVWRLPRTWLSYQTLSAAPEVNWQPAADGVIWLGCFNNLGKITTHTIRVWSELLHALPEANLLLKNKDLADEGNRSRILAEFSVHGITPARLELQAGSDWQDYMAQHDRLDIALDPIGGHGGGTSTCDALWMGVPVIHLLGVHVGARFAASLLTAIGHAEWIAHSEAEYIAITVALAKDLARRKQLRRVQRSIMQQSPLCDARGLARALEDAYCQMFENWYGSTSKKGF